MGRKITVVLELTEKQAERLKEVAIGEDMASEDPIRAGAFAKVWKAINLGREQAEATKPDVRTCSTCKREVAHSKRGLRMPVRHKCPHGKDCANAYKGGGYPRCKDCSAMRRAEIALVQRAEDGLPEQRYFASSDGRVVAAWPRPLKAGEGQ
jgi:hypothetical protein